jgi:hypothetical protein
MKKLFFLGLIFQSVNLLAQSPTIPTGSWRTHLSYHNTQSLALADDRVYVASANGLFYLDKTEKSLQTISKKDGLSDALFSRLAYHSSLKTLIITYQNGNIDLLKEKEIINIRSILNSQLDKKKINHIVLSDKTAYLSADFGMAALDLSKNEIKEIYSQIGLNAKQIAVYAAAVTRDSLFAATEEGVKATSLAEGLNRLDFRNWRTVFPATARPIRCMASLNDKIYFGQDQDNFYEYDRGKLKTIADASLYSYQDISASANSLLISTPNRVLQMDQAGNVQSFLHSKIKSPRQALADENGKLWIADEATGLISNAFGNCNGPKTE